MFKEILRRFGRREVAEVLPPAVPVINNEEVLPSSDIVYKRVPSKEYENLIILYIQALVSDRGGNRRGIIDVLASDPIFKGCSRNEMGVLDASNLESPETVKALSQLVVSAYDREKEKFLKKWRHDNSPAVVQNKNGSEGGKRGKRKAPYQRPNLDNGTNLGQPESRQIKPREIVVEKLVASVPIPGGLGDKKLATEIQRSKSDIPESEILEIIKYLQTAPEREVVDRYKKPVSGGVFGRYHEVRKGQKGRLLFFIDSGGILHIRMGRHDEIYGTRRMSKDPARSL